MAEIVGLVRARPSCPLFSTALRRRGWARHCGEDRGGHHRDHGWQSNCVGVRIGTTPRLAVSGAAHSTGGDRHSRPSTGSGWPTTCVCPVANEPPRSSGDTELRPTSPSMCGRRRSQRCPDAPNALWPMSTQPPLPLPQHRPSPAPAAPCVDAPDAGRPVSDRQALDPGIAPDRLDELHASGHPTDLHDDAKDAVIRGRGWANIPEEDRGPKERARSDELLTRRSIRTQ